MGCYRNNQVVLAFDLNALQMQEGWSERTRLAEKKMRETETEQLTTGQFCFYLSPSLSHCPSPCNYFASMLLLAKRMVLAALHVVSHFGRGASRGEWMWYTHKWSKCSDIRIFWTHINRALSFSLCTCTVSTGTYLQKPERHLFERSIEVNLCERCNVKSLDFSIWF